MVSHYPIMHPEAYDRGKRAAASLLSCRARGRNAAMLPAGCQALTTLPRSYIVLEGNQLRILEDIYACFGFANSLAHCQLHSFIDIGEQLKTPSRKLKAAAFCQGWTVLIDPECVLGCDEAACAEISLKYNIRVLSVLFERQVRTYGISLFENDEERRDLRVVNGDVYTNFGASLPGEPKEISTLSEVELLTMVRAQGLNLSALLQCDCFYIDDFTPNLALSASHQAFLSRHAGKPWWQFWD